MPVYLIKILSLYVFFTNAVLSAELDTQLKKLPFYNKLNGLTESSEDAKKAGPELKKLWDRRNDPIDPNAVAKLYYQSNIDSRPCTHCPKYLNLTLEVNKIVEKAKADNDPAAENDTFIQLSKLKFLYYVVRSENEQGVVNCQKVHNTIEMSEAKLDGNFNVIKDVIVRMPEISDFQLYPKGRDEIYYYYRGEGEESNIVIEVVMHKNGTANLRYYEFQADDGSTNDLKLLQQQKKIAGEKKEEKMPNNHFSPTFEVKTSDTLLPQDITFLKAGIKNQLAKDINILLNHEASVNEQTANVDFERDNGQKWFTIQGKNITDGGKTVSTTIPVEIELNEASKLKLNGKIQNNTSINSNEDLRKGNFVNTQTASVGLKDENNEYLSAETNFDSQGFVSTSASNRLRLTEKTSIGSSVTYEKSGLTSYSLNANTSVLGHGILLDHGANINEQTANVVFERDNGQKWLIIQGKNITDGGKTVSTTIPVEIELEETSKLKLNGKIQNTTSFKAVEDLRKGNYVSTQTATVELKDENNEYLITETNFDPQGFVSTSASNRIMLTERSSIGSAVTYERSGLSSYSVSASTSFLGNDKLQTSFGTTSDQKRFVSAQYERKFSETGTLVLGTRYERSNVSATAHLKLAF